MKIKNQRDFWSGLLFIVVGIGFAWGATNYNFGSSARPGPGYFPFGLGILLSLLGAVVLFKALTIETEGGEKVGAFAWRPLLTVLVSIAVFGLALPKLGMIATLPILIVMSSWAGDEFRWRDALINSIVLTAASWGIFIKGLALTIPLWPSFIAP
jgi:NADH:ubiquinone oxidoreductase subunit 4 (subunit M)